MNPFGKLLADLLPRWRTPALLKHTVWQKGWGQGIGSENLSNVLEWPGQPILHRITYDNGIGYESPSAVILVTISIIRYAWGEHLPVQALCWAPRKQWSEDKFSDVYHSERETKNPTQCYPLRHDLCSGCRSVVKTRQGRGKSQDLSDAWQ